MGVTAEAVEIRHGGRLALTVGQAAVRYGMSRNAVQKRLVRAAVEPLASVDGRTPVYDADKLREVLAA